MTAAPNLRAVSGDCIPALAGGVKATRNAFVRSERPIPLDSIQVRTFEEQSGKRVTNAIGIVFTPAPDWRA